MTAFPLSSTGSPASAGMGKCCIPRWRGPPVADSIRRMRNAPMLGRCVLLALTTLSACAATTPPGAGASDPPHLAGAYGSFLVGQYAASRFDFRQAAAAMRSALGDDPAAAPSLAGETFLLELLAGNTGTASALATALPQDPLAQLLLAGTAARAGHWHEALRRYQSLPTPDGLTAVLKPLLVAWAQKGAAQTSAALATLQGHANTPGLRTIFALHTALIADQANLVATAAQNYGIVQGSLNVTNLRLAEVLASWDARTGDVTGANQILDQLSPDLALAMTVPALKKRLIAAPVPNATDGLAEVYVNLAAAFQDEVNNDPQPGGRMRAQQTVLTLLQLGLQLRPDLTEARLLLSEVIDRGNNAAVAIAPLGAISTTDPLYPLAALREAVLLSRLGQTEEARQKLQQLSVAYPWSPEPELALGDLLRQQSDFLNAAVAYTKALAILPANSPATWVVYYDRAMCYDQGGDWARALPDLEQALKLSPGQPYVLNYLGYSWAVKKQNMAKARQMIEQALQAVPNDGAIIDSLGYVMLQQGETQAAVTTLTKAVKLEPEDPTINAHLGDAYAAAGDHLQAIFQWRRALQLDPPPDLASELLAKLQIKQTAAVPAASN
jgi:tetratricopeptide (TPR) repeat protein